jgi:hypothetical protein
LWVRHLSIIHKSLVMMPLQMRFNAFRMVPRCELLEDRSTPSVTVRFDYSLDTSGFFADAERRAALQRAADSITSQIGDSLWAISPNGSNTWTATVYNPINSGITSFPGLTVGTNEIVIFVAGGALSGGALGLAGGGAYSASGSQPWLDTIRTRGQSGVDSGTDYVTWGGMIGFNSTVRWNFSQNPPAANQYDFQSVATHELMHIFGFGLGNRSFTRYASSGWYTGPNVRSLGYNIRMDGDGGSDGADHFASAGTTGGVVSVMNSAIMMGDRKGMTALERAALRDIGWAPPSPAAPPPPPATPTQVTTPTTPISAVAPSPPVSPPATVGASTLQSQTPVRTEMLAVGSGAGTPAVVQGYNANGQLAFSAPALDSSFTGGARIASADWNRDGYTDYVVGAGAGGAPLVQLIDGRTGAVALSFYAYNPVFRGGVYVALGDVTGDGQVDIVTGAGAGGGPHVKVFDGMTLTEYVGFFGINDASFTGGVRVAVGDLNNDGYADIVAAAGEGGGPRISTWNGRTIAQARIPTSLAPDFFAYEATLKNGAYIAVGDVNGDGDLEILTGSGEGGGPRVSAFSSRELLAGRAVRTIDFFTGDPMSGTGVRVAAIDVNGDGRDDLVTGPGPKSDGIIRVYSGTSPGVAPFMTVGNILWASNGAFVG